VTRRSGWAAGLHQRRFETVFGWRRHRVVRTDAVSFGAVWSKPLHDLDEIAIRIAHEKSIASGDRGRLSRRHAELRKMVPGGRGILDLQREMAWAGRVGRLPLRGEALRLAAEVEIGSVASRQLPAYTKCHVQFASEKLKVKSSRSKVQTELKAVSEFCEVSESILREKISPKGLLRRKLLQFLHFHSVICRKCRHCPSVAQATA